MNLKIIHSDFEINLVDTSFTMVEENNWFSDKVFSKYTFPIAKNFTDAEDAALNFILENTAQGVNTIFDVYFYVLDEEHEAVMEIERIVGRKVEFQVRYGFEEFPNFDKKLAQLPLHKFELVGETIYQHAKDKISLGHPATDYNFPQIFTDQFDTETPQWQAFLGRINNYTGTVFVQNEYDAIDDLQLNRNVIQPLPSLLYVLKAGFADKGYALSGDILNDPEFKDAWLFSLSEFYSAISNDNKQEMVVNADEFDSEIDANGLFCYYEETIVLPTPGRYKIAGNLYVRHNKALGLALGIPYSSAGFHLDGELVDRWTNTQKAERYFNIDVNVEVPPGNSNIDLRFFSTQYRDAYVNGELVRDANILDVTVTQLVAYNPDGSPIPTLISPNEIDLTACVPDCTFGDLYKAIKLWKNYGISIEENTVYIDLVKDQLGKGVPKDLSHKEIMEPERTSNQGKTFELKFTEIQSDVYDFPSIYIDHNGATQLPYVAKEGTEEIIIDAVPLPRKSEGGVLTAHGFLDDKQKIQLVLYNGTTGGLNLCNDPAPLMLTAIYVNYYQEWIDFLLNTVTYLWTFNDFDINVRDLKTKTTVYAYGVYHVIYQLSKKNLGADDIIQTEIETYSIK